MPMMGQPTQSGDDADLGSLPPGTAGPGRPRHAGPPTARGGPLPPPDAGYWDARPEQPSDPRWWPDPPDPAPPAEPAWWSAGPGRTSVPPWLFGASVLVLVGMIAVLGFVTPGFFVTKVFDPVAVQNGVRSVLVGDYRLTGVHEILCPADQRVLPGRDFTCVARIGGSAAQVRVIIRDADGHYLVSRPN
jgi:hypothetical protein